MLRSAEKWVGKGLPQSSGGGWEPTGFVPVAIKRVKFGAAATAEQSALNKVRKWLKGKPGPHHVTVIVDAVIERPEAGGTEMLFITR